MFFLLFSSTTFLFSTCSLLEPVVVVVVVVVEEEERESLKFFTSPNPFEWSAVAVAGSCFNCGGGSLGLEPKRLKVEEGFCCSG